MLHHAKLGLSALLAGCTLLLACSAASADEMVVEPTSIRAVWSSLTFANSAVSISCPVTLEGSFHSSTFEPSEGMHVGDVTRVSVAEGSCTGGRVRFLAESLPWRIEYESVTGTSPEISGVRLQLVGAALQGEAGGVTCLYQSSEARPLKSTAEVVSPGVEVTGLRADESAAVPLVSREFLCSLAGEGRVSGTATVTELGTSHVVDVAQLRETPLRFRPLRAQMERFENIRDVRIEASEGTRRLGTLTVRGGNAAMFGVSTGCNGRTVGPAADPRFCTITVSFVGELDTTAGAYVDVPVDELTRLLRIFKLG